MSYVLFSKTSKSNGTRDKWLTDGLGGFELDASEGLVNGVDLDVARSLYDAHNGVNKMAAAFGLGFLCAAGVREADPMPGDVLLNGAIDDAESTAKFLKYVETSDLKDGADGRSLTFALDSRKHWNKIKNIEVDIDDEDLPGIDVLNVTGFVDTRIQFGDIDERGDNPDGGVDVDMHNADAVVTVNVKDAKRGELEATGSDAAIHYNLLLASNGKGWQNSFDLRGSAHDDKFIIDASDSTKLGKFKNKNTNGELTKIVADMGDGDDIYNALGESPLADDGVNDHVNGLWSTDIVTMGQGLNNVATGNGNDMIRIDLVGNGETGNFETVIHDFDIDGAPPPEQDVDTLVLRNVNGGEYDDNGVFDKAFYDRAVELGFSATGDWEVSTKAELAALAKALATDGNTVTDAYIVGTDDLRDLVFDFGDLRHVVLRNAVSDGHSGSKVDLADFDTAPANLGGADPADKVLLLDDYDDFKIEEQYSRLTEADAFDYM